MILVQSWTIVLSYERLYQVKIKSMQENEIHEAKAPFHGAQWVN